MLFCTRDQITDLLLADYVQACEEKNPGLVDRTVAAVTGEIMSMLSYRYPQPWPTVPDVYKRQPKTCSQRPISISSSKV